MAHDIKIYLIRQDRGPESDNYKQADIIEVCEAPAGEAAMLPPNNAPNAATFYVTDVPDTITAAKLNAVLAKPYFAIDGKTITWKRARNVLASALPAAKQQALLTGDHVAAATWTAVKDSGIYDKFLGRVLTETEIEALQP